MAKKIVMLLACLGCQMSASSGTLPPSNVDSKDSLDIIEDTPVQDSPVKMIEFPLDGEVLAQPLQQTECIQQYTDCVQTSDIGFVPVYRSSIEEIDEQTLQHMMNVTWREGCPVHYSDLRKVRFVHWNLTGGIQWGELIVHKDVAIEIEQIFGELYSLSFPMNSVKPMYHFGGSDDASMTDNNTSSFNCRKVKNSVRYSEHSYGTAIDINPFFNPWVQGTRVDPPTAGLYADRTMQIPGVILVHSDIVQIFKKYGWFWGGTWRSAQDYQHFSKSGK